VSAVLRYETHFFDPSQDRVAFRLLELFGGGVVMGGLVAGLLVWGIACWVSRAMRPLGVA